MFNQPSIYAIVPSQPLSSNSTTNNNTTGFDPLTGSTKDAHLVSITSNDPLTDASLSSSSATNNGEISPIFKMALRASPVENASLPSNSPVLEGMFGNFNGHRNSQLNIKDANGNSETFSLNGDGEGEVFKTDKGEQVIFTGTDASTKVQISAFNNIEFGDYIGSSLNVQTKGSIKAGNITLKNTAVSSSPGLSLQSGLSDVPNLTGNYSVTDLGTFSATGINNSAQVVGYSNNDRALLYSDGKITDLGTLIGGSYSYASGINDSGQVVGYSNSSNGTRAFLYTNNQITDLGTLPNGSYSYASGINDSGQVVGGANIFKYHAPYDTTGLREVSNSPGLGYHSESYTEHHDGYYYDSGIYAFIDSNGQMTNLGTLPGYSNSYASGINNSGQVVGYSNSNSGSNGTHAFIDTNGQMTHLGTLPGGSDSYASGINDSGQVVGYSYSSNGIHAFIDTNGQMTDLGTLPGYSNSFAAGINNSGQVVGYSSGINGTHAFIDTNGHMTDLNSLISQKSGWTLEKATAINKKGQIVGSGIINGQTHAFLLNHNFIATPKDGITVGNISTMGSSILLQGLKINLTGSNVVSKGGNITLDGPTILNSSKGAYAFDSTKSSVNSMGGDITFKNNLDGYSAGTSSLSLTAGLGNITFNNAVGSNASLKDLTVYSAKTVTAKNAITTDGNTTISATQDITTDKLISRSGAVSLTSKQGAVKTQDITSGSNTTIAGSQNIGTGTILANTGTVSLTSNQGSVTTQDITTNGSNIIVKAQKDIATKNIISNGGIIGLVSNSGSITTGYLRSNGTRTGGKISLLAAASVKVQGSVPVNGNNYSIYTGTNGEGSINIEQGGGGKIPFVVGDATTNGTVGAISIGTSKIWPTSSRHIFSGSYTLGSSAASGIIRIINSGNTSLDKSLKQLIASESDGESFALLRGLVWLGEKIFEGGKWAFELLEDGLTQITYEGSGGSLLIQEGRVLTAEEADIAAKLVQEGKVVEAPLEGTSGVKGVRYSDFVVDGVKTELKTVSNIKVNLSDSPNTLSDKLSNALAKTIREAAGQAEDIIIDARSQPGMNRSIAQRAAVRAEARLNNLVKAGQSTKVIRQVRVIGSDFDLTVNF